MPFGTKARVLARMRTTGKKFLENRSDLGLLSGLRYLIFILATQFPKNRHYLKGNYSYKHLKHDFHLLSK